MVAEDDRLRSLAIQVYDHYAAYFCHENFLGRAIPEFSRLPADFQGWWVRNLDATLLPVARHGLFGMDHGPRTPPTP